VTYLTSERHRPFGPIADQFCELLRNYPDLSESQIEEMITSYSKLTILEVGLLSADDLLSRRFDSFTRDHSDRLNTHWKHHLLFALVMLGTFAMMGAIVLAAMR
jgi:hypothetical protein